MKNEIVVDKNKLHHYKLKITTQSPVHIGTGEAYEPTNFVVDDNKFYHFDEVLFYKSLNELDKQSLNTKMHDYMQIIDFYKSKKSEAKSIANFECTASKRVQTQYDKKMNLDGKKNQNLLEIQTTFKNPNTFRAIIPGSSIKGMLDTVFKIYAQKVKENDARQNLIVSDAMLVNGGVEIGFADRRHRDSEKQSKQGIYQIIEVIQPKSEFICTIHANIPFEKMYLLLKDYHSKRYNSRYKETDKSFIAKIGKNVGMDYMVEVDNVSRLRNKDGKPLATHFLYSSDTLLDEEFGWIKMELIDDMLYQKSIEDVSKQEKTYHQNVEVKQKAIKAEIEDKKNEQQRAVKEKEQKELLQKLEEAANKQAEQERLSKLSPFDVKLEEIIDAEPNKTMSYSLIILNNLKNGSLDEFQKEALEKIKQLMIENGEWREIEPKPKPPKPYKDYKRTVEIKIMLSKL